MLFWLLACGDKDVAADSGRDSSDQHADTRDSAVPHDTGICADAGTVTWNSWGRGFLTEACQACHASTATNRYGAPEDVAFDTVDEAWTWADRILARAASDPPSMPPAGGVTEDDRTRLTWGLSCGEEGS